MSPRFHTARLSHTALANLIAQQRIFPIVHSEVTNRVAIALLTIATVALAPSIARAQQVGQRRARFRCAARQRPARRARRGATACTCSRRWRCRHRLRPSLVRRSGPGSLRASPCSPDTTSTSGSRAFFPTCSERSPASPSTMISARSTSSTSAIAASTPGPRSDCRRASRSFSTACGRTRPTRRRSTSICSRWSTSSAWSC